MWKYMNKVTFNTFYNNLRVNEMIYYSPLLTWITLFLVYICFINLPVMWMTFNTPYLPSNYWSLTIVGILYVKIYEQSNF